MNNHDPSFPYELFEKIYDPKEGDAALPAAAAAAGVPATAVAAVAVDLTVDAKVRRAHTTMSPSVAVRTVSTSLLHLTVRAVSSPPASS